MKKIIITTRALMLLGILLIPLLLLSSQQNALSQAQQEQFQTYENPDYKIKILYPDTWKKSEENLNTQPPEIVEFSAPENVSSNILFSRPVALIVLWTQFLPKGTTFEQYTSENIKNVTDNIQGYKLLNSTPIVLSDNHQGQKLVFYDYTGNAVIKKMRVFTMNNQTVYGITYDADPGRYLRYLPLAQKMIDSFQFIR
jgi:serine/threonine-protein kinase